MTKRSEARMEETLKSMGITRSAIAILNPGAGWSAKQWAPKRYGELATALGSRGLRSVINYGPGEESLAREAVAASAGSAVALSSSISELLALARRPALFVAETPGRCTWQRCWECERLRSSDPPTRREMVPTGQVRGYCATLQRDQLQSQTDGRPWTREAYRGARSG